MGPSSPENVAEELFSELDNNSAFYIQKDQLNTDPNNADWQLLAVQALIEEGETKLADSIITYLQKRELSSNDKASLDLLVAQSLFAKKQFTQAQKALRAIDPQQLSYFASIASLSLQANLYSQQKNHSGAAKTLLALTPLLKSDKRKQQYNDLLLSELSLLPSDTLEQYQKEAAVARSDASLDAKSMEKALFKEGWYALAGIYQRYQLRASHLKSALEDWKYTYAQHPAVPFMPTQLANIVEFKSFQPTNIAVLLPLSGRFQQQGKAIQQGIFDAFYRQQQASSSVVSDGQRVNAPTLHFYDTNAQPVTEIAPLLAQNNIDFVIGPLLKNDIDVFLPLVEKMPVLALNSFSTLPSTDNNAQAAASPWHYSFSLSPEQEAKQAVQFISENQHQNPLVIAPNSDYGRRVAQTFKDEWLAQNQREIEQHFFTSKSKLGSFIGRVLQTDESKARINQMQSITNLPLEKEVRSRSDIDAIYLVSKRDELILIKPFIDVSVSPFADKIPIYASSRSHEFDRGGLQNRELSNFKFSDLPFLINQQNAIMTELNKVLPRQSYSELRLFALGFDSYQLVEQLVQLQNNTAYRYQGLVGELRLDLSNTVQPQLSWAKYYQGNLVEITSPAASE
ncbi:penicillin-binding protein activator [Psychromonas sp.]|uniref:penicillin-binding protein activator n=1 Tax=Psychromonas sp. TaxID=1884585 RepID=UPI0035697E32